MIPTLYDENEINLPDDVKFKSNGLGLLNDTIYCYVEEERNEGYEMELAYPVGSFLFEEIKGNRFIKAKANEKLDEQIFRIYYISQPLNGEITVKAEHISYILKDNFIEKVECTGNCKIALDTLNKNAAFPTRFNFNSNISMNATYKHERENFWECIKGSEGSIIDTYGNGADIVRDNFNLSVLQNAGQDNNILIAYRKNMTGFTCEEDWTGCKTRIYPYAVRDDIVYTISEKYVDSEYINRDPIPRIEAIDFSGEFEDDEEITEEKLRTLAHNYFILNAIDIPKLSYKVEFVTLSKTEEFKNIIKNENLGLFDTVIIRHEIYNIDTKIRILKVKYDSLLEKYETIELNYTKPRMSKSILQTVKKQKKEIEETIEDTKEELSEDIEEAKEEAANATNNLKITFEAKTESIELSIKNEAEERETAIELLDGEIQERVTTNEFSTYKRQTDREISQMVKSGDGFTSELKQNVDAFQFLFEEASGSKTEITRDGLTIYKGGIRIKDSNGNTVFYIDDDGTVIIKNAGIKDLNIYDTSEDSMFFNALANMDVISTGEVKPSRLTLDYRDFYIGSDGYDLKEFVERIIDGKDV